MKATVADGMKIICESEEASVDLLVLDVDQKDPSLPLRCPPECFITSDALQKSKKILSEDGIMGRNACYIFDLLVYSIFIDL